MPIYEFYCRDCHTIYNFRVQGFDDTARPKCPDCGRAKLEKQISLFAISKGRGEGDAAEDGLPDLDDAALEKAMMSLEREMGDIDEDNPQAMAKFMRKLYDSTGLRLNDGMEEAIRRMESGEDPDKIEEEMGDVLEGDDILAAQGGKKLNLKDIQRRIRPPRVDKTLYDL